MRRTDIITQARQIRDAMQLMGRTAPDDVVLSCPAMFDKWVEGFEYVKDDVRLYGDRAYRCLQSHTSQEAWKPSLTPALWAVINASSAGTIENPIIATRSMEYEYGKYYLDPEDGCVYLCKRGEEIGSIILHYLPHELIGQYFELGV